MMVTLRWLIRREILLAMRRRVELATALLFFVVVVSLFPIGVGPEANLLRRMAPGVIWVAALLSTMLSINRVFESDHADGTLEQLLLSGCPLGAIVAGKVCAHWLLAGLPLVVIAPLLAIQFDVDQSLLGVLALSLLIGTPVLSLIGAIAAALTLGLRSGGVLIAILVLPLYIPVLIMGTGAVDAAGAGLNPEPHLLIQAALLLLTAAFGPWAIAAALRISSD